MNAAHTKPYLNGMSNGDLDQYRKFIDYMLVRCPGTELEYWADEYAAILIERNGRTSIQALSRLPYGLTIT